MRSWQCIERNSPDLIPYGASAQSTNVQPVDTVYPMKKLLLICRHKEVWELFDLSKLVQLTLEQVANLAMKLDIANFGFVVHSASAMMIIALHHGE